MNALRVLAAAALLITSQAYATAPVAKNTGCPNDVGCSPSGTSGGGGGGATKPPVATAPAKAPVATPPPVPKITGITLDSNNVQIGQPLGLTVSGEVGACNYYLTIVNTDNNEEWPLPKISAFPAPQHMLIEMNSPQYSYGNYKVSAKARSNDVRPGPSCQGGGNFVAFNKPRPVLHAAADAPQIVDVLIEQGKKISGANRYRSDEAIKFNVVGSVENSAPGDDAKRCGWTLQLVAKNGTATTIGANSRFGVWQSSKPLAKLEMGSYTLTARTTGEDDALAKQPCLGKATKNVEIFGVPGVIKGLGLQVSNNAADIKEVGTVDMSPQIVGPTCSYKVTRIINKGKAVNVTTHMHVEGVADKLPRDFYPDDQTELTLIVSGTGQNYWQGGSCEGSAQKILTVYDDKKEVMH